VSRPAISRVPLLGAALLLAVALGGCGGSGPSGTASAASGAAVDAGPDPATDPPSVPGVATAPAPPAAPATTVAPRPKTPAPTAGRTTTPSTPPTTAATAAAAPAVPAAPATPTFAPGQRINPTSAQVQTAITTLTQRIPLFKPTDPQLRTFADAVCASFDQGQTKAQVQATVRDAVSRIPGASLSEADAEFAVRIVVGLRCPGYLQ
jgi:pyruvate/2-oxoglutarate dehydrogenase complex dihydrolipoamide acyltransferase (E2) component